LCNIYGFDHSNEGASQLAAFELPANHQAAYWLSQGEIGCQSAPVQSKWLLLPSPAVELDNLTYQ
jgi:hypothetical protein